MKRLQYFTMILVLALLGTGCSKDWVDTKPNGAPSLAYLWDGESNVDKGIASLYISMRFESTWGRNLFWMQNASDDLIVGRSKADGENIKNFICSGREGYMTGPWNDLYTSLANANAAIEGVQKATNVSEDFRKRALG